LAGGMFLFAEPADIATEDANPVTSIADWDSRPSDDGDEEDESLGGVVVVRARRKVLLRETVSLARGQLPRRKARIQIDEDLHDLIED
jgi:hypothetical protein